MKNNNLSEEWRDIPNYEGLYQVSNLGRVKSLNYNHTKQEKILKQANNKGYLYVLLYNQKKRTLHKIHRLVATAFIPNPNNLPFINHKDENPLNNRADNLEWCTAAYNSNYGTNIQRRSKKLTNRQDLSKQVFQYDFEGKIIKIWQSTHECSRNGYNQGNVAACCRGKLKQYKGYIWSYTPL